MNPTELIQTYLKDHGPMSHDDLGRALDILPSVVLETLIELSHENKVRPSIMGDWHILEGAQ